jgi:hypothetical protein
MEMCEGLDDDATKMRNAKLSQPLNPERGLACETTPG